MSEPASVVAAASRRHLGGGALASTASQVAVLLAGAITSIAIARAIGPSGSGAFALSANLFAVALLVAGIGIKQGIVVLSGAGRWQPGEAVRDLALPLLGLGLAGAGLGALAWALGRDGFLEGLPAGAVPLLLGATPFGLAWQWSWSLALGRERYEAYAVLQALPTFLALLVAVTLAIALGTTAAVVGFAAAQIVAGCAGVAWAFRFSSPGRGAPSAGRADRLRAVFRFGAFSWATELLQFVNFRFDLFFLAAYAATADVGIYSVAATATGIALILPQSLSVAVMPRTAALEGAASRGELERPELDLSDARASRHTLLLLPLSGLLVGLLVVVGIPLLYGSRFDDAVGLGLILLPGTLALGLAKVFISVTMGRGRPRYSLYTVLITVPPTVAGYLLVIPDHGATGAALVSTASYLLSALVSFLWFRHVTGIPARDALIPRADDLRAYPEVAALTVDYLRPLLARLGRRRGRG